LGGWVYIMASAPYGTLYIGVTGDISRRIFEHREGMGSAFCRKYSVHRLVYSEPFENINHAITGRSG
jgi:putative endonuclease